MNSATEAPTVAASTLPPPSDEIARRLAPLCRAHGITRLEIFGSVARGDAQPGSDVDLVLTLSKPLGWDYFTLDDRMSDVLGVPVHVLSRDQLDTMTNPFFKTSILADLRVIYDARHESA
ncbi:MAG: nucleotidyltransferase domain-containing protein [Verrucomicrobia bacterium]|nr:nucleotidyltransferase domain-containing protein [Verrucomicrobiota bacterium]